jgi:hypothetical protein
MPEFNETGIPLRFFLLFPSQNLVDLGEHEPRSATIKLEQHVRIPSK